MSFLLFSKLGMLVVICSKKYRQVRFHNSSVPTCVDVTKILLYSLFSTSFFPANQYQYNISPNVVFGFSLSIQYTYLSVKICLVAFSSVASIQILSPAPHQEGLFYPQKHVQVCSIYYLLSLCYQGTTPTAASTAVSQVKVPGPCLGLTKASVPSLPEVHPGKAIDAGQEASL